MGGSLSWLVISLSSLMHNVSLGTDPPLVNYNPEIFSVPQALKNSTSPSR